MLVLRRTFRAPCWRCLRPLPRPLQIGRQMKPRMWSAHLQAAEAYARLSYATRLKVGCLIVLPDDSMFLGYNGTPPDWDNACETAENVTKPEVVHAEQNALDKMLRAGRSSVGATVFITHAPCLECAKRLHGARVSAVYWKDVYRSTDGLLFLEKAGIPTFHLKD